MPGTVALVVAAGRGSRLGGEIPKQYLPIAGQILLRYSLETLRKHPLIQGVRVVIHPDDRDFYNKAAAGLELLAPVSGGDTRQQSVLNGLESLVAEKPDLVLIHDGARPFLDSATIDRVIAGLANAPGAIAAMPVADTVKRANGTGAIADTIDRRGLWRAQTPQGFRYADILKAHRAQAGRELTDDAAVAEQLGFEVVVVQGSEDNFKVTTREDLGRAERRLIGGTAMDYEYRTGSGFDVHAFEPGDGVWLCGVKVPFEAKLKGHSDADVALHALTDALLGAVSAGDIGQHFPPSDPRWKGANSAQFIKHAADLVAQRGGMITHLDVTIICERPKLGPHREAMVMRLAEILGVAAHRVSVKATTTEKLGFTGRGEGIAAMASATVRMPSSS
ncbi:MAG: bifunctional 2-C-methyl-D-erythritol 4-phosphate cytidylyltransferase/2-C-methyl-D-erythritol 2,4-cyclodiphosphate synthase [Alphaproteobacteria bacterium]